MQISSSSPNARERPEERTESEMTSENEEDAVMRLNHNHPIPNGAPYALHPPPPSSSSSSSSMKGNPRILSLLLRAIVMALVVSLFFLFVGIAAIILLHICIAGKILHRRTTTSNIHFPSSDEDDIIEFGVGFLPKDLEKLPSFYYEEGVEHVSVKDCPICLEGFREGEQCRSLPGCKHVFHANCIDTWLIKASACPICRGEVELEADMRSNPFRQEKFVGWV